MTGFSLKTVLFYAAYLCLAARAAPTVVTTLSPASVESTTDTGSAMTTVAPQEGPVVPAFQCSVLSTSDYRKSVSSLYTGFGLAQEYINNQLTPGACSPNDARVPIFNRVGATESSFTLEQGFAIFQAYSTIANLASQSDAVSEADRAKMQIVHELLNSLISNYYEVVSPDHCLCGSASSNNCVTIPNLNKTLTLDTYPESCSPAAYVSINIVGELQRLLTTFRFSYVFQRNFDPISTSCQQWKDDYLSPNSSAASAVSC